MDDDQDYEDVVKDIFGEHLVDEDGSPEEELRNFADAVEEIEGNESVHIAFLYLNLFGSEGILPMVTSVNSLKEEMLKNTVQIKDLSYYCDDEEE